MTISVGVIIKSFGYQYIVEVGDQTYNAVTKSKKTEFVVGDRVEVNLINQSQCQITKLITRTNLVYRSVSHKSKLIASNIDQMMIIIAVKPTFNPDFLDKCLVFAESEDITPMIIINKMDLPESSEFIKQIKELYQDQLGYSVHTISAIDSCEVINDLLKQKRTLLIGQSGMGKSTITAKITGNQEVKVGDLTKSQTSGAHTTTYATLYHVDQDSDLVDCPGLHEFGLYHLAYDNLDSYFPEIMALEVSCKFRNCRHLNEPGCAVIDAYKLHKIDPKRYDFFSRLSLELLGKPSY